MSSSFLIRIRWLLPVVLVVLVLGCNEPTTVIVPGPPTGLTGTWDWFEFGGAYLVGRLDTNDTTDRLVLDFDSDSILTRYINGVEYSSGPYSTERYYSPLWGDTVEFLIMDAEYRSAGRYQYKITRFDTLRLEMVGATDAGFSRWLRRKP